MMGANRELLWIVAVVGIATSLVAASVRCETLEDGLSALREGYDTMALPKLQEAIRILSARAAGPDDDGAAHYHLARALEGLAIYHANGGSNDDAVRLLQDAVVEAKAAIERHAASSPYHTTLGDLYGQLAGQSGLIGRARYGRLASVEYARALALDPTNAGAHVGSGIGKLETPAVFGGSVVEALREFRTAQELDPGYDEAWIWEGVAHRRQGSIAEARRALLQALEANPRSEHAKRELAALEEDFQ